MDLADLLTKVLEKYFKIAQLIQKIFMIEFDSRNKISVCQISNGGNIQLQFHENHFFLLAPLTFCSREFLAVILFSNTI